MIPTPFILLVVIDLLGFKALTRTFIARRYAVFASIVGGVFGVVLGVLSASGFMEGIDPLGRGLLGVIAAGAIGILVAPMGAGFKHKLSKSVFLESAVASILSTLVMWPVVYALLS